MGKTKDKKKQKISEVPEIVREPWSQSWGKKKRDYGGNDLLEKIGFKMGVKEREWVTDDEIGDMWLLL